MPQQNTASPDAGAERLVAGRYRLLSVLGEGGMGTVWRARDEVLHREVAVKEVRAPVGLAVAQVERMYTRLEREAWAAARISARGVVTVHDVATDDGRPWIVMEFVRGGSLADVIGSQGALPPREAARIGAEVLAALRAAHGVGVLHRDVKPANVLLADDGRVVLTDFGIATVEGDSALTMTGELVGSPEYLAPERALGRNPGPASDLWSLGALLYTAVQGRSPFRRTTPLSTLRAIVDDELPPPHRAGPLATVIEGLMRKDPDARMSAEQAEQELRLAGADGASGAGTATAPSAPLPAVATEELPTAESPLGETAPAAMPTAGAPTVSALSPVPDSATDAGDMTVTVDASTAKEPAASEASANTAAGPAAPEEGATATVDVPPADTPTAAAAVPPAAADPRTPYAQAQPSLPGAVPAATAETATPAPRSSADAASPPTVDSPTGPAAPGVPASPAPPLPAPEAASASGTAESPSVSGPVPAAASAALASPVVLDPGDAEVSGHGPTKGTRRIGYAAGAVVLALLVGGLGYVLGGDDDEGSKGSSSPTGQAQASSSGAASSGSDDSAEQPVSVTATGGATTYVGDCPPADSQAPWFTATFTVSELPFQFSYRWVSTNGSVIDRQWRTLSFPDGGPRTHKETVRLSTYAQSGTLRSEMAVEIRSPFEAVSNSVPFSVTCTSTSGG
ncbi:serine/threonine-protein kinase [Streptomyces sp. NBC_00038]|uniref:serine/threonine-protein kinase n=1 Tax=Streptomyces sp. NBC_00038 TaxID=2903615 RepID=UPI0022552DF8|nr:serine/threonine-protein kinase [Streptomyces sp. NBC_00038]MCX5561390.1 protein kinase [Streptomyces sp. NBC_00038]